MTIYFYTQNQPNSEFANFAPYGIEMEGLWWPTVEHYYQASKFEDSDYRELIRQTQNPRIALKLGKSSSCPPIKANWDEIKYEIMFEAVFKKFTTHQNLAEILLATGYAKLAEDSPFDYYWGIGADGSELNMLGKILMKIRTNLKKNGIAKYF